MKTSIYSILCIAIRIGAILWAIDSLANLPFSWIAALSTQQSSATVTWLLCGEAVQLLVIAALWLYPGMLARFAASRSSRELFEAAVSPMQLQYIALSVLGAWFALEGCVFLSYELVRTAQFAFENFPLKLASLAESGVRIVGGLALMLGARGLAGLLGTFRERGGPTEAVDNV